MYRCHSDDTILPHTFFGQPNKILLTIVSCLTPLQQHLPIYSKAIGLLQPTVVSVTTNVEQHDLLKKGMFPVECHPPASLEPV